MGDMIQRWRLLRSFGRRSRATGARARLSLAGLLILAVSAACTPQPVVDPLVSVIEAGREDEIRALFRPFRLGDQVVEPWRLSSIGIDRTSIRVTVANQEGAEAAVVLRATHETAHGARRTASFAVEYDPPGSHPALEALVARLEENDEGDFWQARKVSPELADDLGATLGLSRRGADGWLKHWALWALLAFIGAAAIFALELSESTRRMRWAAILIPLAGVGLRVGLSPRVILEAWPYTRVAPLAEDVLMGPALAWPSHMVGGIFKTDVIFTTHLVLACVTPLFVLAWARRLLRDDVAAIMAMLAAASLPLHLRFSHSDVFLVESLALVSAAAYLVHVALEPGRLRLRGPALVLACGLSLGGLLVRPLDFMHALFFTATALWLVRRPAPREPGREWLLRGGYSAVVLGFALMVVLLRVTPLHGEALPGLGEMLTLVWGRLISLDLNTLINPRITPPWILAAALIGVFALCRARAAGRAVVLVLWIGAFFALHSAILPFGAWLQARYHLHLVLPLAVLAGAGLAATVRWNRWGGVALIVAAAVSPLTHAEFIRDVDYNDQAEFRFVESLRDRIPPDCTILEYTGAAGSQADGSRFKRLGTLREGFLLRRQWRVVETGGAPADDPVHSAARRVLVERPDCLLLYEGLACRQGAGASLAPACARLRDELADELRLVRASPPRPSRCYDEPPGTAYCDPDQEIVFSLWEVGHNP